MALCWLGETLESDIDFLAIFDPTLPHNWEAIISLQEELITYFGRQVGILDSRKITDVFRPAIDNDPIDIMEMELSGEKDLFNYTEIKKIIFYYGSIV